MGISKEEIADLAARYVHIEGLTFPCEGDLFYFLARKLPENKVLKDDEGWNFNGYAHCSGYEIDDYAKPAGKWLFMHYRDLTVFPPDLKTLKLQPPHVIKGRFFSEDRTVEYSIVKCRFGNAGRLEGEPKSGKAPDNIIHFPIQK